MPNLPKVGLDALRIQDSQQLKNALLNCDDPMKAISDFQEENCILLPTLKPALNLIDLHNVRRLEFHMSIADELKDQLTKRVEDLASIINLNVSKDVQNSDETRKLEELLEKSFPLINMPRLTPLILLIMKSLPKVDDIYLNYLTVNENLYTISPIEVKRQIWSINADLFQKELKPHFDKFINYFEEIINNFESCFSINTASHTTHYSTSNLDQQVLRENLLLSNTAYSGFFRLNKRYITNVNEIVKLIGTSKKLYDSVVNLLSNMYLKTHDWFYSTLRSQIILKISETSHHDALNSVIAGENGDTSPELTHKFGSIINTFLKEKKIEPKRAKELEAIMESKKFEKILSDVAFILADPFVVDMLSRNAMSLLNRCVQNELLPRNCTELIFVLRLLSISLLSFEIIDAQSNKEPKMDSTMITEYLPNLAYFLADYYEKLYDDALTNLSNPTPAPSTPSLLTTSPTILNTATTTPPTNLATVSISAKTSPPIVLKISTRKIEIVASIKTHIVENELCSVLLLYLVIVCLEINDWINLKVLLPAIRYPNNNSSFFEKWFFYQFFHMFNDKNILEQFKHEWFISLIFEEFLMNTLKQKEAQSAQNANAFHEQIYKLIDRIYPNYLTSTSFSRLLEIIKPKKSHSSNIHVLYVKLKTKLDSVAESGEIVESVESGKL